MRTYEYAYACGCLPIALFQRILYTDTEALFALIFWPEEDSLSIVKTAAIPTYTLATPLEEVPVKIGR